MDKYTIIFFAVMSVIIVGGCIMLFALDTKRFKKAFRQMCDSIKASDVIGLCEKYGISVTETDKFELLLDSKDLMFVIDLGRDYYRIKIFDSRFTFSMHCNFSSVEHVILHITEYIKAYYNE